MVAPNNQRIVINNIEFAQKALETHGTIPVLQFSRLVDLLNDGNGQVAWALHGGKDIDGAVYLQLQVTGSLNVICQRCLQAMQYPLAIDVHYLLVQNESELPAPEEEGDDADYLLFQTEMSVLELVEDELLLTLPIAPKHESGQCATESRAEVKLDEYKKPNPFARLEALKSKK